MHVQAIIQNYRISKLQRGLQVGITRRVEDGKYAYRFPFGYVKAPDGSLALDPPATNLLVRFKDQYLRGASLRDLAELADASGVPAPNGGAWNYSSIAKILKNPFYAGKVFKDRWQKVGGKKYSKHGKVYQNSRLNPTAQLLDGKHPALWTWDEHLRLLAEHHERYKLHPRHHPRIFSGLLVCVECKQRLKIRRGEYVCPGGHISIAEGEANDLIGPALVDAIRNYKEEPEHEQIDTSAEAIETLKRQIAKIQRAYETTDTYTPEQAAHAVERVRAQIRSIQAGQMDAEKRARRHAEMLAMRERMLPNLEQIPWMIQHDEPENANRYLRNILTAIHITPKHEFIFDFRG